MSGICKIFRFQGTVVTLQVRLARWQCRNRRCQRRTFADRLPEIARSFARRTCRAAELARLVGHAAGGRPAERLMTRLGLPQSDDTILRNLKRHARSPRGRDSAGVGIDDWSWRKGCSYGTIMIDLERREVIDVLSDRSAEATAGWLSQHTKSRSSAGIAAASMRGGPPGSASGAAGRRPFSSAPEPPPNYEQQLSRAPPPGGQPRRRMPLRAPGGGHVRRPRTAAGMAKHRQCSRRAACRAEGHV